MIVWIPIAVGILLLFWFTRLGQGFLLEKGNLGRVLRGVGGLVFGAVVGAGVDSVASVHLLEWILPPVIGVMLASGYLGSQGR